MFFYNKIYSSKSNNIYKRKIIIKIVYIYVVGSLNIKFNRFQVQEGYIGLGKDLNFFNIDDIELLGKNLLRFLVIYFFLQYLSIFEINFKKLVLRGI